MNQVEFLGLACTFVTVSPSNLQINLCQTRIKKGTDAQVEMNKFTVAREVLHNNYQFCSPYHFWGINPRNSTLFTTPFFAGRYTWAGHKTRL